MSFEVLEDLAGAWAALVDPAVPGGIAELLTTARRLFAHAWFCYEFMAVACLVSIQAVEATFRQVVFPDAKEETPFRRLIARAASDGRISADIARRVDAGAQIRNRLAHPGAQPAYTVGAAAPIIEMSHRTVSLLASQRPEP